MGPEKPNEDLDREAKRLAAQLARDGVKDFSVGVRESKPEIMVYVPRRTKWEGIIPLTWRGVPVTVVSSGRPRPA